MGAVLLGPVLVCICPHENIWMKAQLLLASRIHTYSISVLHMGLFSSTTKHSNPKNVIFHIIPQVGRIILY
jgi:hypothetical protein